MTRFTFSAASALLAAGLITGSPASAHPRLIAAAPAVSATVRSPARIGLRFSEPLVLRFSGLVVSDRIGRPVMLLPARLSADRRELAVIPAARLATGTYRLRWHAVSTDTHRVEGSYRFNVR